MKYRVIVSRFSCDPEAYCRGLIKLVACGEKTIPASSDITILFSANSRLLGAIYRVTDRLQIDKNAL